jgi:WD40 repeat protein
VKPPVWRRLFFFLRPPWRGLLFKFGVGIGVATLAVTHQDMLPSSWRPVAQAPTPPTASTPRAVPVTTSLPSTAPATPPPARSALEIRAAAQLPSHRGPVLAIGFQQSGRRVVTLGSDQQVRISELDTGTAVRSIALTTATGGPLPSVASPPALPGTALPAPLLAAAVQGSTAVTAHADGSVIAWDLDKGERIAATRRLDGAIAAVSPTADADRIAVAGNDGKVMILDRRSNGPPAVAGNSHADIVRAMTFVPERNGLLTASADKTIKSWNGESLSLRRTYVGHREAVTALDAAPDGRSFASGADDGAIRLWSMSSNQARRTLRAAHTARISALAHAPDGDVLASAAGDGTVKLWDLRRGREIASLQAAQTAIRALAFTSNGRRLVTAAEDGSVRLWEVPVAVARRGD